MMTAKVSDTLMKVMKTGCGLAAVGLSGCVNVTAPDKPIVIELNINIKQEVVYKLDKGVQDMINENSGIF